MARVETDLNFKWDVLKDLHEFEVLKKLIIKAAGGKNYRQILSHHTTDACQTQKTEGQVPA